MHIDELQERAYQIAKDHGFHDKPISDSAEFGLRLALIHSELSEALEAERSGEPGFYYKDCKPEGVVSELADVVIRVADLCGAMKWDLQDAIYAKMAYNRTRQHKHGKRF